MRATRDTLCRPRALRAPAAELGGQQSAASRSTAGARRLDRVAGPRPAPAVDAGGDGAASCSPGTPEQQLVGIGAGQRHDQIEAVEQRSRDAAPVAGAGDRGARAGALVDPLAARAGVHGRDEEEGGREGDGPAGAADPDHALLEWLAQCLEGGHGELAELVEEQDAVGGQADLAGPQRPAAAADQRDDGGDW